jgi:hypothetical protein
VKGSRASALQNKLLQRLPPSTIRQITKQCDIVDLHVGDTLSTASKPFRYVYFPISGLASLVAADQGARAAVGMIGNEGMIGVPLILGVSAALQGRCMAHARSDVL